MVCESGAVAVLPISEKAVGHCLTRKTFLLCHTKVLPDAGMGSGILASSEVRPKLQALTQRYQGAPSTFWGAGHGCSLPVSNTDKTLHLGYQIKPGLPIAALLTCEPDNSLLWALSCVWQDAQQHAGPSYTNCQQQPPFSNQK